MRASAPSAHRNQPDSAGSVSAVTGPYVCPSLCGAWGAVDTAISAPVKLATELADVSPELIKYSTGSTRT